jgi:ubiquinone/menaquinone biosynthesis C-methylase UbiE
MDALRKLHNDCKRQLIQKWVKPSSFVLDCGCGRGGDWWKWQAVRARIAAIDPDLASIKEAESRASEMGLNVLFLGIGTIIQAAFAGPFDAVCYNFSLHYIFEDELTYKNSIKALALAVRPGGLLFGITPDKDRAESMVDEFGHFKDEFGNEIAWLHGGRRLLVRLVDGPFYADGGREEPTLEPTKLVYDLKEVGFELVTWEPMLNQTNGMISDLYSKFVFKKID